MAELWDNLSKFADNVGTGLTQESNKLVGQAGKLTNNIKNYTNKADEVTQEKMMSTLDWAYTQTINGVPGQKNVDELVEDYLSKYDKETAIEKLVHSQTTKAATSGFVTGFGGLLTMPVSIPANITSVLLIQMRMIAAIAKIRGYDLNDDQVRTYVYVALTGTTVSDIVKKTGIIIGNKMLTGMAKKIPGRLLTKINQAVGFRLVTKFGTTGVINIGKMVPVAGAVISCSVDSATTLAIAKGAKKSFTELGYDLGDGTILDKKVIIVDEKFN
ncbi:EcsC family protein [Streptococcus gallolyticus]|uniref:EcsC family protein n=1 Tax=Streptococcus gallolyticus TaxID=315405 RepID=UPI002283D625|nr:EcsC family protein [Streptococcus gallolyticus]MCY7187141.1 EcsC family protein [Streptococcus gallolyticus subsp. gallolyticus]